MLVVKKTVLVEQTGCMYGNFKSENSLVILVPFYCRGLTNSLEHFSRIFI